MTTATRTAHLRRLALSVALLGAAATASAESTVHADLFFIPQGDIDLTVPPVPAISDDGTGFGARLVGGANNFTLHFEYQTVNFDAIDDNVGVLRLGAGIGGGENVKLSGIAEIVSIDFFGADVDGFGFHARIEGAPNDKVSLYAQLGQLILEDSTGDGIDGPEYTFGGRIALNEKAALFAELHKADLTEDQLSIETEFTDLRIGASFNF